MWVSGYLQGKIFYLPLSRLYSKMPKYKLVILPYVLCGCENRVAYIDESNGDWACLRTRILWPKSVEITD